MDESVTPFVQKHCRIRFYLRDKMTMNFPDNELKYWFDAGIIETVNDTREWVSPVVMLPKRNSYEIRLCFDMTQVNKAIKRERHVQTLDELW